MKNLIKRRKIKRKILIVTFIFIACLVTLFSLNKPQSKVAAEYTALTEVPGEFIAALQNIIKESKVEWQLLASYFYLATSKDLRADYPSHQELSTLHAALKSLKPNQQINYLVRHSNKKIKKAELKILYHQFQHIGYFYDGQYTFPLPQGVSTYRDTWLKERDGGKRQHLGTDIFALEGTPVYTVGNGTVERIGTNPLGGERVGIRGEDGLYYYYAHLLDYAPQLTEGAKVKAGDLIGHVGHSGNAQTTPDHLHFGIMTQKDQWLNPYNLLKYWEIKSVSE